MAHNAAKKSFFAGLIFEPVEEAIPLSPEGKKCTQRDEQRSQSAGLPGVTTLMSHYFAERGKAGRCISIPEHWIDATSRNLHRKAP